MGIETRSRVPRFREYLQAMRLLLTQDNVDILAGWVYSPNAIASAPVASGVACCASMMAR